MSLPGRRSSFFFFSSSVDTLTHETLNEWVTQSLLSLSRCSRRGQPLTNVAGSEKPKNNTLTLSNTFRVYIYFDFCSFTKESTTGTSWIIFIFLPRSLFHRNLRVIDALGERERESVYFFSLDTRLVKPWQCIFLLALMFVLFFLCFVLQAVCLSGYLFIACGCLSLCIFWLLHMKY